MTSFNRRTLLRSIATTSSTVGALSIGVDRARANDGDGPSRRDLGVYNNSGTTETVAIELVDPGREATLFAKSVTLNGLNDDGVEDPSKTRQIGNIPVHVPRDEYLVRARLPDGPSANVASWITPSGIPDAYGVTFYVTHDGGLRAHGGWV